MKRFILLFIYIGICFLHIHAQKWVAGTTIDDAEVKSVELAQWFVEEPISDAVFDRMKGKSFASNCTTNRADLRYLKLLHRNRKGKTQRGELVCNKAIAKDLIEIFKRLYEADYVIERMVLVDEYDANDEKSMTANNTSCFNFRYVTGSRKVSKHGQGMAIDINPLYNPCYDTRNGKVEPAAGKPYATNRTSSNPSLMMIDKKDLCYRLFVQHGFRWGGNWKTKKDYQHFER